MEEKRSTVNEVLQCSHFREKRGRGINRFRRGKEHTRWLLFPARRCDRRIQRSVAVASNRSQTTSRLSRGRRQPVGPVALKCCLGLILLWRSNRLSKWNGLEKRYSWSERKLWRRILGDVV
jgi:hypothetical protein